MNSVLVFIEYNAYVLGAYCHNCNCDWWLLFHHWPSWSSLSSFSWRVPRRKENLQAATVPIYLCCLSTQVRMHCIRLCPLGLTQVVLLRTCTNVTDSTHLYCLLPCVRVRCGLYPHGLTVVLFWFSPLCESLLWTVSTWAYCFTLLVFSLVWESVADCIHLAYCFTL